MSSGERVSNSRGKARDRPLRFLRDRLIVRAGGNCLFSKEGELVGDGDMRVSLSIGSSDAFRFRLDMELCAGETVGDGLVG